MDSAQKDWPADIQAQEFGPWTEEQQLEMEERAHLVDDGDHPLLSQDPLDFTTSMVRKAVQMWQAFDKKVDFRDVCNYVYRLTKSEERLRLQQRGNSRSFEAPEAPAFPHTERNPHPNLESASTISSQSSRSSAVSSSRSSSYSYSRSSSRSSSRSYSRSSSRSFSNSVSSSSWCTCSDWYTNSRWGMSSSYCTCSRRCTCSGPAVSHLPPGSYAYVAPEYTNHARSGSPRIWVDDYNNYFYGPCTCPYYI